MTMVTHTAGPWKVDAVGNVWADCKIADTAQPSQAEQYRVPSDAERDANARLIAAAPDLLALAHQYRNDLRYPPTADSITRRLAAIDAVLAKVKGE